MENKTDYDQEIKEIDKKIDKLNNEIKEREYMLAFLEDTQNFWLKDG